MQRLPQDARWTQKLKCRLKQLPSLSRLLGTEALCTCEAPQMLIKRVPVDESVQIDQPRMCNPIRRAHRRGFGTALHSPPTVSYDHLVIPL